MLLEILLVFNKKIVWPFALDHEPVPGPRYCRDGIHNNMGKRSFNQTQVVGRAGLQSDGMIQHCNLKYFHLESCLNLAQHRLLWFACVLIGPSSSTRRKQESGDVRTMSRGRYHAQSERTSWKTVVFLSWKIGRNSSPKSSFTCTKNDTSKGNAVDGFDSAPDKQVDLQFL